MALAHGICDTVCIETSLPQKNHIDHTRTVVSALADTSCRPSGAPLGMGFSVGAVFDRPEFFTPALSQLGRWGSPSPSSINVKRNLFAIAGAVGDVFPNVWGIKGFLKMEALVHFDQALFNRLNSNFEVEPTQKRYHTYRDQGLFLDIDIYALGQPCGR